MRSLLEEFEMDLKDWKPLTKPEKDCARWDYGNCFFITYNLPLLFPAAISVPVFLSTRVNNNHFHNHFCSCLCSLVPSRFCSCSLVRSHSVAVSVAVSVDISVDISVGISAAV